MAGREVQRELLETAKGHREESLAYYESLNTRTREVLGLQVGAQGQGGKGQQEGGRLGAVE